MNKNYQLINGDCLEEMKNIPDGSIDLCLTDPPYGTTACKWDSVIPFEPMWKELKHIVKPKGAICLFGSQPFTSALIMSNPKMFKYVLTWKKERGTGFARSAFQPLRITEDIMLFGNNLNYFPQLTPLEKPYKHALPINKSDSDCVASANLTSDGERVYKTYTHSHPTTLLEFARDSNKVHPTQKPVELLRYLIRTYTQENETVLDFTMGSGSTGVAAMLENRRFIGIEKDENYFNIAQNRIEEAINKQ